MKRIFLLLVFLVTQIRAQDWRLERAESGEKIFVDYAPKLIVVSGKKMVAFQMKSEFEEDMKAVTTHYFKYSKGQWFWAFKSQIEYNWDGTTRFAQVKEEPELEWQLYKFNNSVLESIRLTRARKILGIQN